MIEDIRKYMAAVPFVPFTIRMASGHEYPVPTIDHIWIPPGPGRVLVADDQGLSSILPGYAISGVVGKMEDRLNAKPPTGGER